MSATRQPTPDTLAIDRAEAIHAKHSLQAALEMVNRNRVMLLPGPQADQLDHAARLIVTGITVLRDADRTEMSAPANRAEEARDVTCPNCDRAFSTRAKEYAACPACGKNMRLNVTRRLKKQKPAATRHPSPDTCHGGPHA